MEPKYEGGFVRKQDDEREQRYTYNVNAEKQGFIASLLARMPQSQHQRDEQLKEFLDQHDKDTEARRLFSRIPPVEKLEQKIIHKSQAIAVQSEKQKPSRLGGFSGALWEMQNTPSS